LLVIPAKTGRALQQRSWSSKLLFRKIEMDFRLTSYAVEKRLAEMTSSWVLEVPKCLA
jgi:hypothetical protein